MQHRIDVAHIARLLVIFVVFFKSEFLFAPNPFAQFISVPDHLFYGIGYRFILSSIIWVCLGLIIIGKYSSRAALVIGFLFLWIMLSNQLYYSNNTTLLCCLFIILGLSDEEFPVRAQLSIMYLGAFVNKVFDPDWMNGVYFENFISYEFSDSIVNHVSSVMGLSSISAILTWASLLIELSLFLMILIRDLDKGSIFIALLFHGGMLVLTSGQISVTFFYLVTCALLAIRDLSEEAQAKTMANGKGISERFGRIFRIKRVQLLTAFMYCCLFKISLL